MCSQTEAVDMFLIFVEFHRNSRNVADLYPTRYYKQEIERRNRDLLKDRDYIFMLIMEIDV